MSLTRKRKAAYAAMVLIILLTSAEIVLRLVDFSFYYNFGADLLGMPLLELHSIRRTMNRTVDFDPRLFWKFKPNQVLDFPGIYRKTVTINSHGFRGPDWEDEKPPGVYRVACLGDSTTFGWSVGDQDTFAALLQQRLDHDCPGRRFEVMNLGVTGYSSLQGRELMKLRADQWKPDLVIFAFGPNDRLPALLSDQQHLDRGTWNKSRLVLFLDHFQLYKLAYSGAVYLGNLRRGLSLDPATYIPQLKRKVSPEEFAANVREVKKICDRIGADLILIQVDYPSLPLDHVTADVQAEAEKAHAAMPPHWPVWPDDLATNLARELGVPSLALRPLFEQDLALIEAGKLDPERARALEQADPPGFAAEPWRYLMIDNGHPNRWGHEIIADQLFDLALTLPRFREACPEAAHE